MKKIKLFIALVLTIVMAAGMFTALGGEKARLTLFCGCGHDCWGKSLGDGELFLRYVSLLDKFFPKYGWGTVHTAIQFMRPLLPAVDSEQAAEDLTRIRAKVAAVSEKNPAKWNQTLALIDQMLTTLKK